MSTRTIPRQAQEAPPIAIWRERALFLCAFVALGAALALVGGWPRLPVRPDTQAIREALLSPDLRRWQGMASWLFAFGWLVWAWTALSLLLQAVLFALEALTRGAAWARALRLRLTLSPLVMPLARRAFPVLAAAVIVARTATGATSAAAATPATIVLVRDSPESLTTFQGGTPASQQVSRQAPTPEHRVVAGETLWKLAERYYGTGEEFARLHEANLGCLMPDGTRYAGRLVPGQVLLVPEASHAVERVDGRTIYVVERGDTLSGIAARLLGDERQWPAIFEANAGVARIAGRANPD